jgi:AcrR family transcriptional regulator
MGISERKEREKQEMRGLILKTAMSLFLVEGFQNVSIRRIAEKIEYSPGTIYLYFKDKDEILHALHDTAFEELFKRQQTVSSITDPLERLRKQGRIYVQFAREHPKHYDLMFIMRGPVRNLKGPEEWDMGRRAYEFLRTNVQECIDAGYFNGFSADIVAFAMWASVHGVASLFVRERCMCPEDQLEALIDDTLRLYGFMMEGTHRINTVPSNA